MSVLGELIVRITGDNAQFDKSIDSSEKKLTSFDKRLKTTQKTLTDFGKKATTLVTLPILGIGTAFAKAAIDAEETRSKFATVFRDLGQGAETVADDFADNFGLAGTKARELLGDTGDLLSGFGFTGEAALDLSRQVNELAVDLASFTNFSGGAEGASAALTKALLGERESIKSLGIAITEADIDRLAEDKGIVGELDRQQKALLTLELAVGQSKNAIGDFDRTQFSAANQIRQLQGDLQDLAESFGRELLPIVKDALTFVRNLIQGFTGLDDTTKKLILIMGGLAAAAGPASLAIAQLSGALVFLAANPLVAAVAGVAAFVAIMASVQKEVSEANVSIEDQAEALRDGVTSIEEYDKAIRKAFTDATPVVIKDYQKSLEEVNKQIEELEAAQNKQTKSIDVANASAIQFTNTNINLSQQYKIQDEQQNKLNELIAERNILLKLITKSEEELADTKAKLTEEELAAEAERLRILREEEQKRLEELEAAQIEELELLKEKLEQETAIQQANDEIILGVLNERLIAENELIEEQRALRREQNAQELEEEFAKAEELLKIQQDQYKEEQKLAEENAKELREQREKILDFTLDSLNQLGNTFVDFNQLRLDQIEEQRDAEGNLTEELIQEKKRLLEINKAVAVADSLIAGASAVVKTIEAFAFLGPLAAVPAGIVGGLAAAQTAAILATPIPALADGGLVMPSAGGQVVRMAEAGVPEFAIPERSDVLGRLADRIVGAMPGPSTNIFQPQNNISFPDKLNVNIDGQDFRGWINEESRNGRIQIDFNRGIAR